MLSVSVQKELLASLVNFYTRVYSGLPSAAQPSSHLTAGKLSKVCPHKVKRAALSLLRWILNMSLLL